MTIIDKKTNIIKRKLTEMSYYSDKSLKMVEKALKENNVSYIIGIKENDIIINKLEEEIKSLSYSLLIRQQPVASDFRYVSSVLKIITDIERIGDYAKEISDILLSYNNLELSYKRDLIELSKDVIKMNNDSINSFLNKDYKQAEFVIKYDDYVDRGLKHLKQKMVDDMVKSNENYNQILDVYMIAKYFERCGDRCVNIAEALKFI